MQPLSALVQPLVVRGLRPAAVGEHRRTARALPPPAPGVALYGQLVRAHVTLAVEEAGDVPPARRVAAYDLDSAPWEIPRAAVGGVEDEESPRRPLVDVAGEYLGGRRDLGCHGVALVDPLADDDVPLCSAPGSGRCCSTSPHSFRFRRPLWCLS